MLLMVPHVRIPGTLPVMLVHVAPPSRDTCTRPSFEPAYSRLASSGDSAIANSTPAYSTPMLSGVRPPLTRWRVLSLRVRSGEIVCHDFPPSVVRCTYWLPT